jgi:DNA adenine methylase
MQFEPKAVPFLRWVGGKRKFVPTLAPAIREYLVESGGTYFEPFSGGLSMALALGLESMEVNDIIEDLVRTYRAVKDTPVEVGMLLCELREWGTGESHYYAVRDGEPDTDVEAAARMIYLNAHCFNGLWRTNRKGKMNAAYGKKPNRLTDELLERMGTASGVLQGTIIQHGDFEPFVRKAQAGDLVYVDPPYDGAFTNYAGEDFQGMSQERLAATLYDAHQRGVAFLAHNSDTEKVRWWYNEFATLLPSGETRSVNRDGGGRGKAQCLIITNEPKLLLQEAIAT